jgi:hypothetical protein
MSGTYSGGQSAGSDASDEEPIVDELVITDREELVEEDFAGDDEIVDDADRLDDSRIDVARGDGPVIDD